MKILTAVLMLMCFTASAQTGPKDDLFQKIKSLDSIMFAVVYKCNAQKVESFFTEDLEFYHDKGGLTKSRAAFMQMQKNNFCGERPFYLRREPVPGTMKVFLMDKYGAVQTGEHVFYVKGEDGKEKLDGKAKYTHLWKYEQDQWKIARVISYDHGPAN
ncbi:nuclear transport factor 2 family protein [Chryseolinea sp. H1M3-3]|uniref:nuclear transport factor 2 family protein n=1 Tax=Chryseolinea sp. H1M3-3 TaxID=3034144 RepID=UPI0023EBEE57|nr:nuclear transport factor 2 family protein [Chryseolinea sp. H1M3-3]